MLVLTRKSQQEIIIADNIRLTVLEIRGNRVKLGVTAPEHIDIRRIEVEPHSPQLQHGELLATNVCN